MKVSSIIVAKKHSVRLPKKNMLPFGEYTLLGHKITQLFKCKHVHEIVVGTDCDDIIAFCKQFNVKTVRRQGRFCDEDNCTANDMIKNMISLIEPTDIVMWSHCTNPNIQPNTYDLAIKTFINKRKKYDSLISVDIVQEHLWDASFTPLNYNPWKTHHILAKELPVLYKQNGAIFLQDYIDIKENNYFFGKAPYLFETPILESTDINTQADYAISKYIFENLI